MRPGLVARDALVARLAGGADRRLSLICAPAGWGKTVLLAQWHASERRPFAWVSLDPSDDDPVRFWSYVIAALRTVVPGFGGAVLAALPNAGPGLVDVVLPRLINELAELPEPVVLVLDDYPRAAGRARARVGRVPAPAPAADAAARARDPRRPAAAARPPARRRRAGRAARGRAAFDDEEADALLNGSLALGLERRRRRAAAGADRGLAGRAAARRAVAARARATAPTFIRAFAGDDRQIGDYLHEVIEGAPRPVREFLLRTSILERMCAPLCDAVTGGDDGAALLAEAYRSNLFLVALDERGPLVSATTTCCATCC